MASTSPTPGFQIEERPMTKVRIALAVTLLMGTAAVAMADSPKRSPARQKATPVRVDQNRNMSMMPNSNLMMNVMDRASSPFACGG
jgi:hypothetical protein